MKTRFTLKPLFMIAAACLTSACIVYENGGPGSAPGSTGASTGQGGAADSAGPGNNTTQGAADNPGIPGSTDPVDPKDTSSTPDPNKTEEGEPDTGSTEAPPPECIAGQVKEGCHELPDGTPIHFPKGFPLGKCRAGTQACVSEKWGPCEGAIPPEPKDQCGVAGDDSDCDGVPNTGCACITGETRPCGESDVGECKMGTQTCVDGKWGEECVGAVLPSPERCDGKNKDEDCNGKADLDDPRCECVAGDKKFCERPGQKGDCRWGQQSCQDGRWSRCGEWARPQVEVCGTRSAIPGVKWTGDENCDGRVDTSAFGQRGPAGCVQMMLDQDNDGYGKIGKDLSNMSEGESLDRLATACLCPNRPDMSEKVREGWVREVSGRANTDCGDCRPGMEGRSANPGTARPTTQSNRCLTQVRWRLKDGSNGLGDYDLNCDGVHTDPTVPSGFLAQIECERFRNAEGYPECRPKGKGRLNLKGERLSCGNTYKTAKCVFEVEWPVPPPPPQDGEPSESGDSECKIVEDGSHTISCI